MSRSDNIGARWWRGFYGACVLVALLFGLIEASSVLMERAREGVAGVWWQPLVNETTGPLALVALLPLIRWFDGLFPIRADSWGVGLIAHALFSVPVVLIHVAAFVAARTLIYPLFGGDYQLGELGFELVYEYRKSAVGYAVLLFALYSFRHYVQLRRLLDMPDAHQRGDDPEHEPARPAAPATAAADAAARPPATRRFLARRGPRDVIVNVADIRYVEAAGNYAVLHTDVGELKLRETLGTLERELAPWDFVRVHRSYLVNLDAVREVQPWFHGDQRIVLTDGTLLNLSRRYRDALRQRMATSPAAP